MELGYDLRRLTFAPYSLCSINGTVDPVIPDHRKNTVEVVVIVRWSEKTKMTIFTFSSFWHVRSCRQCAPCWTSFPFIPSTRVHISYTDRQLKACFPTRNVNNCENMTLWSNIRQNFNFSASSCSACLVTVAIFDASWSSRKKNEACF